MLQFIREGNRLKWFYAKNIPPEVARVLVLLVGPERKLGQGELNWAFINSQLIIWDFKIPRHVFASIVTAILHLTRYHRIMNTFGSIFMRQGVERFSMRSPHFSSQVPIPPVLSRSNRQITLIAGVLFFFRRQNENSGGTSIHSERLTFRKTCMRLW